MKKYYSRLKMGSVAAAALLCTSLTAETFTTCGATGAFGPDQAACDAAYIGTELEGLVTVTNGIQEWTVPTTGMYKITAVGAQGASADVSYVGGLGAKISGEFELIAGETLQIVVGQQGLGEDSVSNGGGGGGSFVVDAADVSMIIAGGGGGTRDSVSQNGCDASITEYGIIGSGGEMTSTCAEKTGDLGLGGIVSSSSWGSGGAGFNGDGASDGDGAGGSSWANGMNGGETGTCGFPAHGGFGGGGTGNGCYGGGGGGGYSGGDGGRVAGGGGSYNIGENPEANASVGTGDGMVIITSLQAPTPGAGITDGSGGGCTYNPNTKNIDLMLILMMAMAFLYPLRRRYLK